ncbi:UDP-N-acetylmuramoyl-tripeptide--D-alanyl-D-alanine ligase [Pantoea sp. Aalb]|uniref:UDP-N-acetylmuramoyl-tripeptide--D-alanyl-D- alanine ligase n=1 Tax=Pantoea sp. Aalb TaxID=2576762 RepID=UPI001327A610|nr:UDP-N-acetylmuramoyl-tripeptide--D-alanyl-D-alanine ligase [Pantoea sp. Aalb]MXP67182.1 UDP-N-acetylmuramoyl-tripeptide--D-alanyl-D-alanine ligase [Pantoea sp. Aalb]
MIPISLKTLSEISGGRLYGRDLTIVNVTTDTRKFITGSLFVALIGKHFDAHAFVAEAVTKGASALLVNQLMPTSIPQVVVSNMRIAFGQLGAWVRQQSKARVVALTGSSGKTSVKEMTSVILSQCGKTLCNIGNLNNDLGVPMTLLRLTKEHDYIVIELGANHKGEIAYTTNLVCPEAVLINNLSASHLEGFGSLANVAKGKGEIFNNLPIHGTAIINADSNDMTNWYSYLVNKKLWSFSLKPITNAEFSASDIVFKTTSTFFTLHTPRGNIDIKLPLPGRHNIANALAAAALSMSVDASLSNIQTGLQKLSPCPGRLFPIYLTTNKLVLDDSYNVNIGSMTAAIDVLSHMPGFRVLVTGDMLELGCQSEALHIKIGELVKSAEIDYILSIGRFSHLISEKSNKGKHFTNKNLLLEHLWIMICEYKNITILIKGSRMAAMEQIVYGLQEKAKC